MKLLKGKKGFVARISFSAVLCIFLVGCGTTWMPDQRPETEEERQKVAEHERALLGNIPAELSGHDQDWDDAIDAAHRISVKTFCKTRLYEWDRNNTSFTGRMREIQ